MAAWLEKQGFSGDRVNLASAGGRLANYKAPAFLITKNENFS